MKKTIKSTISERTETIEAKEETMSNETEDERLTLDDLRKMFPSAAFHLYDADGNEVKSQDMRLRVVSFRYHQQDLGQLESLYITVDDGIEAEPTYYAAKYSGGTFCGDGRFFSREECMDFADDGFCDYVRIEHDGDTERVHFEPSTDKQTMSWPLSL